MTNRFMLPATILLAACGSKTSDGPASLPLDSKLASDINKKPLPEEQTTLAAVGLDPAAVDREVSPCDDFYKFACGGWLKNTEIPADKARYGRFTQIRESNEATLHAVLDEARAGTLKSPVAARIGEYYGACMDEAAVEKAGLSAIKPLLDVAKGVKDTKSLDAAIAQLHKSSISVIFHMTSTPDFIDATKMIGDLGQGGLSLPDRDYYLKDDKRNVDIRKAYQEHVRQMLSLSGMSKAAAKRGAADVMKIETAIAKVSMPREARRDPENLYHKIDRPGVEKLVPNMDWSAYFGSLGFPEIQEINVDSEEFFASLVKLRADVKPAAWRNYLTWQILDHTASELPKKFVDQNFKMSQLLSGAKEQPPRWKQCVRATDSALGELLAQPYLERKFTPVAKEAVDAMVGGITRAFAQTLGELEWMSEETKSKAADKLSTMNPMFGYPDKWKKYEWTVDPKNYAANALASASYEKKRDLAKIGKAYDRSEWFMSPQTVNAYYNPQANQMVFPAGILQPPFFSEKAHIPVNLGAIGMIVGHELTHGFDDSGAKFDGDGNMKNWWADADLKEFEARGECVVQQYSKYQPLKDLPLNGKLTLGENIADIGGVKLAFMAYREAMESADKQLVADGYNEDQQFFLAVGQAWCTKSREAITRRLVVTDPHSPASFRVNGSLTNLPEFAAAFSCDKGSAMNPDSSCSVW